MRTITAEDIMSSEFTGEYLGRFEDDYLSGCDSVREAFISDLIEFESLPSAY